jgi:hypothetical protein
LRRHILPSLEVYWEMGHFVLSRKYIEMSAVMAKCNPSTDKAWMRMVAEQQPSREALKIAEMFERFRFNIEFLGSMGYVYGEATGLEEKGHGSDKISVHQKTSHMILQVFFCSSAIRRKRSLHSENRETKCRKACRLNQNLRLLDVG